MEYSTGMEKQNGMRAVSGKKRVENDGAVTKYYVEESHPAIIDKDTWEAVQFEIER